MFAGLVCRIAGHRIIRKRVKFDGIDFKARCERCDAPLIRTDQGWQRE